MKHRLYGLLAASVLPLLALAPAGLAAPQRCVPLVADDRGDPAPVVPRDRQDLDILALDVVTSKDLKTVSLAIELASLPDVPVEAASYNVFFKAGQRSYRAEGYRGLDGQIFELESDERSGAQVGNVQPISGSVDVKRRTVRIDVPLRLVNDGRRPLRRGSVVYGIGVVTADSVGAQRGVTVGTTHDSTPGDNIYPVGAPGCVRA
jgi:hypothetical protein